MLCGVTGLSCMYGKRKVKGKASYYSSALEGRRTSSGDRYSGDSLTCAHRSLPFGTLLKVRNPKTNKEVVVRVNDRGPFARGRIIDLSYAAASKLGFVENGIAVVEVSRYNPSGVPFRNAEDINMYANIKIPMPKTRKVVPRYRILKNPMAKIQSPFERRGSM